MQTLFLEKHGIFTEDWGLQRWHNVLTWPDGPSSRGTNVSRSASLPGPRLSGADVVGGKQNTEVTRAQSGSWAAWEENRHSANIHAGLVPAGLTQVTALLPTDFPPLNSTRFWDHSCFPSWNVAFRNSARESRWVPGLFQILFLLQVFIFTCSGNTLLQGMQRQTNSDGSCLHDFENTICWAALQLPLSLLRNTLLMEGHSS